VFGQSSDASTADSSAGGSSGQDGPGAAPPDQRSREASDDAFDPNAVHADREAAGPDSDSGCGDTTSDPIHCGTCANDCTQLPHVVAGAVRCESGQCVIPAGACADGWAHCSTSGADGCETAANTSSSCGTCGHACSTTAPVCAKNAADKYECGTGCPPEQPDFCANTGTCTDFNQSVDHCGNCTTSCPTPQNAVATCNAVCGFRCRTNFHKCADEVCRSDTDVNHCGTDCQQCPTVLNGKPVCTSGQCGISCDEGFEPCSGACVPLGSDSHNCGRCGHDCGVKATCNAGQCQAAPLVTGIAAAAGLDVSADGIFYTVSNVVYGCTLASACTSGGTQIAGGLASASDLVVTRSLSPNLVAFHGMVSASPFDKYYSCAITGCPASITGFASADTRRGGLGGLAVYGGDVYYHLSDSSMGLYTQALTRCVGPTSGGACTSEVTISGEIDSDVATPFAADANRVYFVRLNADASKDLVSCGNTASCNSSANLIEPNVFALQKIAVWGSYAYFGRPGPGTSIVQREVAGAGKNTVRTLDGYLADLVVDDSGVFWLTESALMMCPLTGCTAGPKTLASGLSGAKFLRSQGNFVYWLIPGSDASSGVWRVAKP
jgi:hypothetical protein